MNTSTLVPIDFSRKITPFVFGDFIFNSRTGHKFDLRDELQISKFNTGEFHYAENLGDVFYVISYADRSNTGKQPVGEDVVVDAFFEKQWLEANGKNYGWHLDEGISKWKPNHAYMVKAYQKSLSNKLTGALGGEGGTGVLEWPSSGHQENIHPGVEQAHHVALQVAALGDNPTLDVVISPDVKSFDEISDSIEAAIESHKPVTNNERVKQLEDAFNEITRLSEYEDCYDIAVEQLDLSSLTDDKPVFTQAQSDAGELPMVGSECLIAIQDGYVKERCEIIAYFNRKEVWVVLYDGYCTTSVLLLSGTFEPIKTDEDKLRDALISTLTGCHGDLLTVWGAGAIELGVGELLASDKFEIKLKG